MNFFIKHYGEEPQLKKLQEECIELVIAIFWHRVKNFFSFFVEIFSIIKLVFLKFFSKDYVEEMGDVLNIIEQFEQHWGDGRLYKIKFSKRERQLERIKNERSIIE